jgi:hypothetical protein
MKIDLNNKDFNIYKEFLQKTKSTLITSYINDNVCMLIVEQNIQNVLNLKFIKEIENTFDITLDIDFTIERIENNKFLIILEF